MASNTKQRGAAIRAAILAAAATADGYAIGGKTTGQYHCDILLKEGAIHCAFVHQKLVRYFLTKEAATAFKAANLWTPSRQITIRKEAPAQQPKQAAEIVHTAKTRYINRTWVDRNAVDVPFRRISDGSFSMSI